MAKKLDVINVIDVEATCWDGGSLAVPLDQCNEIIEIGICEINVQKLEILRNESILVKPDRSVVSEFCTSLTTLTQEQVDGGLSFKEACVHLETKFKSRERLWASYGDYDRNQFQRQWEEIHRRRGGGSYPFGSSHLNVKTLFAIQQNLAREIGMSEALDLLEMPLEGTHHRGVDDSLSIAKILVKLLRSIRTII